MDDNAPGSRIALALDVADLDSAKALIDQTREHVGTFKVGLELYTAVGPAAVEAVHAAGAKCFLDLKLHDIPATMGRSVARAASMGVAFLTVHGWDALGFSGFEDVWIGALRLCIDATDSRLSAHGFEHRAAPREHASHFESANCT